MDCPPTSVRCEPPIRRVEEQPALVELFSRVGEVSTLPTVAAEILRVAADESTSARDLVQVVQQDPALAAKLLRMVNSAYYSTRNRVSDLQSAISMVGFKEVRNLAMTVYVSRLFKDAGTYRTYCRIALWQHLIAVANAARLAAHSFGATRPDEAYLAGLLHDVGLILEDQYVHRRFCQVLDRLQPEVPTWVVEREVMCFDHSELGAFVARRWGFHDSVTAAIRYHHAPDSSPGEHQEVVDLVALANYVCGRRGLTALGVDNVPSPPEEVFTRLRISRAELTTFWSQLDEALETAGLMATI